MSSGVPPDRSGPGQSYNLPGRTGVAPTPTHPRQAATVMLLRGGADTLEVLLVRRTPEAKFMGGVWVFPGGAVDAGDGASDGSSSGSGSSGGGGSSSSSGGSSSSSDNSSGKAGAGDGAHRAAAIRELREEANVVLEDPGALVAFSRWITPAEVRVRFDTHFFLAQMPAGQEPRVDGQECVDLGWFSPSAALEAHAAGDIVLVFPTIKHLEQLAPFSSADALLAHAREIVVEPVLPRVIVEGDSARVLMPGDPGY